MTVRDPVLLITVNVLAWLVIHLGFAWAGTQVPAARFNPAAWPFRTRAFEQGDRLYAGLLRVKKWKDVLPDGATWFKGGFPKKNLVRADNDYLRAFLRETCRGESVHWAVFAAAGLFFLWNTPPIGLIMIAYGAAANFPCIIVQRYNRNRIRRVLRQRGEPECPDVETAS